MDKSKIHKECTKRMCRHVKLAYEIWNNVENDIDDMLSINQMTSHEEIYGFYMNVAAIAFERSLNKNNNVTNPRLLKIQFKKFIDEVTENYLRDLTEKKDNYH